MYVHIPSSHARHAPSFCPHCGESIEQLEAPGPYSEPDNDADIALVLALLVSPIAALGAAQGPAAAIVVGVLTAIWVGLFIAYRVASQRRVRRIRRIMDLTNDLDPVG